MGKVEDPHSDWIWEKVQIDEELEPYDYVVTSEMLDQYRNIVDNPGAAYPTVAGRHALRAFSEKYGDESLMNVGAECEYYAAVVPDRRVFVTSRIVEKYFRRDKPYIIVEAKTTDEDGRLIEISRLVGLAAQADKPLLDEVAKKWEK